MKRLLATILAAFSLTLAPAAQAANTWGTDMSDMWWIPSESGWGANIAHQRGVVFMTLYVYGADSRIRWYAATYMQSRGNTDPFAFDGAFYEFTGPFFGAATFDPLDVGVRQVGLASLAFGSVGQGTLTYSIDGVAVTKQIERQTFRENNLAGTYLGHLSNSVAGCASGNGLRYESGAATVIHEIDNSISISTALDAGRTCSYAGTYSQSGRLGEIVGSVACSDGRSGSFQITEIEAGYLGYMGRYSASLGASCTESGSMAWLSR